MPYDKPETTPEWVKVSEVAAQLGIDPRTVLRMIRRSDLTVRALKLDKGYLIHREDWQAEMERRRVVPVGA
ncbi:helix-turn-helix domain-containing protein [Streptomyces sp. DSM 41013]